MLLVMFFKRSSLEQTEGAGEVNAELIEAHIVAQAITELQEIQAPTTQCVGTGDEVLSSELETEIDLPGVAGQTHVIYYIEDGAIARTEDRTLVDSSVQANDYDIERRSGILPARKRVIPVKFRDYKNTSNDEDSDSDFDPHEYLSHLSVRRAKNPRIDSATPTERPTTENKQDGLRRVGRPRKNFFPQHTKGQFVHDDDITIEVEKKYQEALRLSMKELAGNQFRGQEESGEQEAAQSVYIEHQQERATASETGEYLQEGDTDPKTGDEAQEGISKYGESVEPAADGTLVENIKGEPVTEIEGAQTETQRMRTRGKRVPVYGSDSRTLGTDGSHGVIFGRCRGRPRMAHLPYYKCGECGKTFKQKGNLKTHLRLHIVGKLYLCQESNCNKSYRSNESLRRHLLTHRGIKPFQCDICEQGFSSNVSLTEHRSRHLDEKPYQCVQCQKCFRQVSCFRRHMTTHTAEMPYSCTVCQRRFSQTAYLKSHMKTHTGEKPYQCVVCRKMFAHQSDVKRHSTTHTGEKRYSCSKCQAKFSDVSSKNRHEREHENNKRYTCNLCNDTFKRPGQLRSHLGKKHSHTFAVKMERNINNGTLAFKVGDDIDPNTVTWSQQRIVSIIKNLHSKSLTSEGITSIEAVPLSSLPEAAESTMTPITVTDITRLEKEVDPSIIEDDIRVPIELHGVEIQGDENGQTFFAITDLAESLGGTDKLRYQVLYEIDENGEQKQILVPFNPAEEEDSIHLEYSTESTVPSCVSEVTAATETIIETADTIPEIPAQDGGNEENDIICNTIIFAENNLEQKENGTSVSSESTINISNKDLDPKADVPVSVASGIDYVNCPDFSKQEYYNWLTNFTEFCKVVPMPLDVSLFQKISHVHKTLSDVMATPCGVVADKENFRVLMNISKELSTIINEHLVFVLENLNTSEKRFDGKDILDIG